jgi:segregation and condensation protein A
VAEPPEPLDPDFQLVLPEFEGPLDLLLHLIKRHQLEIEDLPVAFITERYLEYVSMMKQLNLDIASEYLVMAATLAYIKSRSLLPPDPDEEVDEALEEEIDPRAELIRRLLTYQKYKDAAATLGGRGIAGRDTFLRGSEAPKASGPAPLAGTSLYRLLDAFKGVLDRSRQELAFEIEADGISIQDRMRELTERLKTERDLAFEDLFDEDASLYDLVVTFMALLEMAKRRLLAIVQPDPRAPLRLRSTVVEATEEDDGPLDPPADSDQEPASTRAEAEST